MANEVAPEASQQAPSLVNVLQQLELPALEALVDELGRAYCIASLRLTCRAVRDLADASALLPELLALDLREDGTVTEPLASLGRWGRRGGIRLELWLPADAADGVDALLPPAFTELPQQARRRVVELSVNRSCEAPTPSASGAAVAALAASLPGLRKLDLSDLPSTWTPGGAGEAHAALAALGTLEELELPGVPGLTGVEALAGSLRCLYEVLRMALLCIAPPGAGGAAGGGLVAGPAAADSDGILVLRGPTAAAALEQPSSEAAVKAWAQDLERRARAGAGDALADGGPLIEHALPLPPASAVLLECGEAEGAAEAVTAAVAAAGDGSEAARSWAPRWARSFSRALDDELEWALNQVVGELWAASAGEGGLGLERRVEWAMGVRDLSTKEISARSPPLDTCIAELKTCAEAPLIARVISVGEDPTTPQTYTGCVELAIQSGIAGNEQCDSVLAGTVAALLRIRTAAACRNGQVRVLADGLSAAATFTPPGSDPVVTVTLPLVPTLFRRVTVCLSYNQACSTFEKMFGGTDIVASLAHPSTASCCHVCPGPKPSPPPPRRPRSPRNPRQPRQPREPRRPRSPPSPPHAPPSPPLPPLTPPTSPPPALPPPSPAPPAPPAPWPPAGEQPALGRVTLGFPVALPNAQCTYDNGVRATSMSTVRAVLRLTNCNGALSQTFTLMPIVYARRRALLQIPDSATQPWRFFVSARGWCLGSNGNGQEANIVWAQCEEPLPNPQQQFLITADPGGSGGYFLATRASIETGAPLCARTEGLTQNSSVRAVPCNLSDPNQIVHITSLEPSAPPFPSVPFRPSPSMPQAPLDPAEPDAPPVPGAPEGPAAPDAPLGPEAPFTPETPEAPAGPGAPMGPGGPDAPFFPGVPGSPPTPSGPNAPSVPIFPVPSTPSSPTAPWMPASSPPPAYPPSYPPAYPPAYPPSVPPAYPPGLPPPAGPAGVPTVPSPPVPTATPGAPPSPFAGMPLVPSPPTPSRPALPSYPAISPSPELSPPSYPPSSPPPLAPAYPLTPAYPSPEYSPPGPAGVPLAPEPPAPSTPDASPPGPDVGVPTAPTTPAPLQPNAPPPYPAGAPIAPAPSNPAPLSPAYPAPAGQPLAPHPPGLQPDAPPPRYPLAPGVPASPSYPSAPPPSAPAYPPAYPPAPLAPEVPAYPTAPTAPSAPSYPLAPAYPPSSPAGAPIAPSPPVPVGVPLRPSPPAEPTLPPNRPRLPRGPPINDTIIFPWYSCDRRRPNTPYRLQYVAQADPTSHCFRVSVRSCDPNNRCCNFDLYKLLVRTSMSCRPSMDNVTVNGLPRGVLFESHKVNGVYETNFRISQLNLPPAQADGTLICFNLDPTSVCPSMKELCGPSGTCTASTASYSSGRCCPVWQVRTNSEGGAGTADLPFDYYAPPVEWSY
ncbi:hypothetical protein HYH03_007866 [Edaphochlamys debaryana]|uniref:Pherophorin domain-containing protein n=1 Tax=Edaphochlamys debaryana TaxID=47281 RepID=A0A835Y189_9CHLO|nr:hypothetical protein HYH03_007866 [Edaphochlamys debaryana]|eukprot:KAG2493935.1 hypothetical protein HYH03_007866 [Edaphochlamys debaryana]